jgi:hypothetical protein
MGNCIMWVTPKSLESYACRAASHACPTGGEHEHSEVHDHLFKKCQSILITPTFSGASSLKTAGDMSVGEHPHEHQEANCVNDMIPTEVIGATAGAAVDHRCLNRLAIASYLDLLHGGHQTGDGYRHKERTTPAHNSFHCFDRRKSWPSPRPNRWNHWFHRSYQGQDSTRFPMSRIRSASSWARMTEKTRALPVCVTRFSSS